MRILKKLKSQHIISVIFGVIILLSASGLMNYEKVIKPVVTAGVYERSSSSIEHTINENIAMKEAYIEINGLFQRCIGKRLIVDGGDPMSETSVVRLSDGDLAFVSKKVSDETLLLYADRMQQLDEYVSSLGMDLLYIQAPFKVRQDDPALPPGITDYTISNARFFTSQLADRGVGFLDLIDPMENNGTDWHSNFFRTDHHWTCRAAFWAFGEIGKNLQQEYGYQFDESLFDVGNYSSVTYENIFLGTQGRRVGASYAGTDDLTLILPDFDTSFERYDYSGTLVSDGSFEECFIDKSHLVRDYYNNPAYNTFMGGDFSYIRIENDLEQNGRRILVVKDSYANPLLQYLPMLFSEVDAIDLRLFKRDAQLTLTDYLSEQQYDLVIIMYNAGAFSTRSLFEF